MADEIEAMGVSKLKALLASHRVDARGVLEKSELKKLAHAAVATKRKQQPRRMQKWLPKGPKQIPARKTIPTSPNPFLNTWEMPIWTARPHHRQIPMQDM